MELKIFRFVKMYIDFFSSFPMLNSNLVPPHVFVTTFSPKNHEQLQPTISSSTKY